MATNGQLQGGGEGGRGTRNKTIWYRVRGVVRESGGSGSAWQNK